jgi:hypothetical protein
MEVGILITKSRSGGQNVYFIISPFFESVSSRNGSDGQDGDGMQYQFRGEASKRIFSLRSCRRNCERGTGSSAAFS